MPLPTDIAALVVEVARDPAPVVCLDACVALDVLRAPVRAPQQVIGSALRMTRAADAQRRGAWIVVCEQAAEEIRHHRERLLQETLAAVRKLADQIGWLNRSAEESGVAAGALLADPASLAIDAHLVRVVDGLLDASHCLREDAGAAARAFARARTRTVRKPARRGGEGLEDCVIVEHYLALAAELRAAGFNGTCLFASSNTRDYAASASDKSLHPDLVLEFTAVGLTYVPSLTRARYEAGLA